MTLPELLVIALGLSMDAFAVSICIGLSLKEIRLKQAWIVGLYFGGFQALMPLLGYLAGSRFAERIAAYDHWIAFVLLALIGGRMIKESASKNCPVIPREGALSARRMLPLAIATSIDALAVGVSFAFLQVRIGPAVVCIGLITLTLSMAGIKLGRLFGDRWKAKAELAGGIVLVLMGIKILLEHTLG
jgi:putative Mn2+ efflux pump MntP